MLHKYQSPILSPFSAFYVGIMYEPAQKEKDLQYKRSPLWRTSRPGERKSYWQNSVGVSVWMYTHVQRGLFGRLVHYKESDTSIGLV